MVFPTFFKSEFANKEFMIWTTVSFWSCFCWVYRASPSLAAKNIISLILVSTIWWCPCVESSLVLLEEGVCYDQCVLLAELKRLLNCMIPTVWQFGKDKTVDSRKISGVEISRKISCLESPVDRGSWWTIVHGVAQSQTYQSMHTHMWIASQ